MDGEKRKLFEETVVAVTELSCAGVSTQEGERNYIGFINYCAERLGKGDSVQAIWYGYLETTAKK